MRRAVEKYIEDPMAEEVLKGNIKPGDAVTVQKDGDKLGFVISHKAEEAVAEAIVAEEIAEVVVEALEEAAAEAAEENPTA